MECRVRVNDECCVKQRTCATCDCAKKKERKRQAVLERRGRSCKVLELCRRLRFRRRDFTEHSSQERAVGSHLPPYYLLCAFSCGDDSGWTSSSSQDHGQSIVLSTMVVAVVRTTKRVIGCCLACLRPATHGRKRIPELKLYHPRCSVAISNSNSSARLAVLRGSRLYI